MRGVPRYNIPMITAMLRFTLLLGILIPGAACEKEAPPPSLAGETPPWLLVNGLYNSGFEWIADDTTIPPKYGAYWSGAFSLEEGDPKDLVETGGAFQGDRFLRLKPGDGPVHQKVVADPRWTDRAEIILAVRLEAGATLEVTLRDGPGRKVTAVIEGGEKAPSREVKDDRAIVTARWSGKADDHDGITFRTVPSQDETPWTLVRLGAGQRFLENHGTLPTPRLLVILQNRGLPGTRADVDEAVAPIPWPRILGEALGRRILERIFCCLDTWFLGPDQGGLDLVDRKTGYVRVQRFHVETGDDHKPNPTGSLHTLYELLVRWLRFTRDQGWDEEVQQWTPYLERFVRTLLDHNFDPETQLPRSVAIATREPRSNVPVTVGAFILFLLDAREVLSDETLKARCLQQARRTADALLALQQAHDRPGDEAPNTLRYNPDTGRFEGKWPNWYGHIPPRLTPKGVIDRPARFNTAWAILTGRSFWYHFFKSASAVMAVHAKRPGEVDLPAIKRVLSRYHREWDAARYDLENDTDDHYGYLCEDLIPLIRNSGGRTGNALALVQKATDHRLSPAAARPDDTLWIQAVRLGTACAGDSPRPFKGLLDFYELPPGLNPSSSKKPLYREVLLELARNDLKGRQLTNAQFTDSFFKNWAMVCICFRGSYQGDCREHPQGYWHGDVGDVFGGPPTAAIKAQAFAYRAASPGERQQILSALGIIEHVTESTSARRYGYVAGLDEAVARQYGLLEKYVTGESYINAFGLVYVVTWLKFLPYLDTRQGPRPPGAVLVSMVESPDPTAALKARIEVSGPSGGRVAVPVFRGRTAPFPCPLSDRDGRMAAFSLPGGWQDRALRLDDSGRAVTEIDLEEYPLVLVQPILLDPSGTVPLALGEAIRLTP